MPAVHDAARVDAEPFFIDLPGRRLFAVHHRPAAGRAVHGQVLCVPAFNEEMNRCRSMLTLQAVALARAGWGTLVVDPTGTGDSSGEFGAARWATWLDDLAAANDWLARQPGAQRVLLGVRLGAILAAQLHGQLGDARTGLAMWQPVLDGKTHLTQFLRVRMAAQLDRADLPKETTTNMRQQLERGEPIEVAGYEIHPELARAIDAAKLDAPPAAGTPVLWLENAGGDDPQLALPSRKLVDAWRAAGVAVEAATYAGPAFWQVHERVLTPSIVALTNAWFARRAETR